MSRFYSCKTRSPLLICLIIATAGLADVQAAPVSAYLPPATIALLSSGEDVRSSSVGRDAALSLLPSHPAAKALAASLAAERPDVVVEAVFLWEKPSRLAAPAELLAVYNTLRAIGSLTGIEYFSASRGHMRLFYESSSLVTGPDGQTSVPDARLSALPGAPEALYARQKDLSFGDNVYRVELRSGADYVVQSSSNITPLRYGSVVPVAGEGDVSVRILALSADDAIVFYAVSSAKAAAVPGMRAKLEASFGNRAEAVYEWFARELGKAWGYSAR